LPKKILEEKILTLPEVKEILEKYGSEETFSYIQKITHSYVTKFSKIPADKARELLDKLTSEFNVPPEVAVQIVNALPETIHELRIFFSYSSYEPKTEDLENMVKLIKKFKERA